METFEIVLRGFGVFCVLLGCCIVLRAALAAVAVVGVRALTWVFPAYVMRKRREAAERAGIPPAVYSVPAFTLKKNEDGTGWVPDQMQVELRTAPWCTREDLLVARAVLTRELRSRFGFEPTWRPIEDDLPKGCR